MHSIESEYQMEQPRNSMRVRLRDATVAGMLLLAIFSVHSIDSKEKQKPQHEQNNTNNQQQLTADLNNSAPSPEQQSTAQLDGADENSPLKSQPNEEIASSSEPKQKTQQMTGLLADFLPIKPQLIEPHPSPDTDHLARRKVEFFESESMTAAVGFVVDCSGSMDGEKFAAVQNELARSICNLAADQKFSVVYFNDGTYPMSSPSSATELRIANAANKRSLLEFQKRMRVSGGTDPEPAIELMAELRPDTIYLLTDGLFEPFRDSTFAKLKNNNITVNAIAFELGGPVPALQAVADRTGGTCRPAAVGQNTTSLFLGSEQDVRSALKTTNPSFLREAVNVALLRGLPLATEVLNILTEADGPRRKTVHDELRLLAGGSDFGPYEDEPIENALKRWQRWWELQDASREQLLKGIASDNLDERWAAASRTRTSRLNAPDQIIEGLQTSPSPIWQEFRAALRQITNGKDFGPQDNPTLEQKTTAAGDWADWFAKEEERLAAERQAQHFALAAKKLDDVARKFASNELEAAKTECLDVIDKFADTPSAKRAQEKLQEIEAAIAAKKLDDVAKKFASNDLEAAKTECLDVINKFADTPSAKRAQEQLQEIEAAIELERVEKRLKLAKTKLHLAKQLVGANRTAVIRRCRELIKDFADTPYATEAKTLLQSVGGTLEED